MGVKSHKALKHGYNITHIDEKHLNIIPFTGDLTPLSYHQECSDVLLLKQVYLEARTQKRLSRDSFENPVTSERKEKN